ncbi:hypothetical protein FBY35_2459 [Streptomyces sp. SLBN-118]|uniref:hypothetical protein n=1 Tax=Streptomyces sp. SLBN-118 TaxID=2768454 RepID=UPI0011681FE9|nr:hypothetical protein [Streptomyces sp. SLBN-118]TQK52034.1 hypothetical protein FBY35_2459 [Streptomyces sp. SLBN-118]
MRTEIENAIREVRQAVEAGHFSSALVARAAYRMAADDEERAELLLHIGPRACSEPTD